MPLPLCTWQASIPASQVISWHYVDQIYLPALNFLMPKNWQGATSTIFSWLLVRRCQGSNLDLQPLRGRMYHWITAANCLVMNFNVSIVFSNLHLYALSETDWLMDSFFLHNSCMPSELVFRGRAISEGQRAKENAQDVQCGKRQV